MEFHQLKSFVVVTEEGSLTRAAEKLFSSQPAVSAHIKALEEELGVRLFERTPRGMVPTDVGARLFEQCGEILAARQKLLSTASSMRNQALGVMRIGLINEPASLHIDRILQRVLKQHPGMRFEFDHGRSSAIADAIVARDLDAGFFEGDCDRSLIEHLKLGSVRLCIAGPAAWEKDFSSLDFHVLETKPWSYTSPRCGYHRVALELAQTHGLDLDNRFLSDEESTALHFARKGLALTLTREEHAKPLVASGELFIWPGFSYDNPLYFGYLKERAGEPGIKVLEAAVNAERSQELAISA
ncbi:MAG: LysR family transcriptional regulator [Opitutaceae bacterium]|jgi:DNA-binding transcriptional LysR family regulator